MVADDDISRLLNEANESEFDGVPIELTDEVFSSLLESLKIDEKTIELPAEDVAWVDSCFAFGTELSDDKWTALKDALLDALDSYSTYEEAPSAVIESNEEHKVLQATEVAEEDHTMEDYPSVEMQQEKVSDLGVLASEEDTKSWGNIFKVEDEHPAEHHPSEETQKEDIESRGSIFKVWDLETSALEEEDTKSWGNIFKVEDEHPAEHHPSEETLKEVSDAEVSVSQREDIEFRESIFKVWDLETSALEEEDDLIQQLNKLLAGSKPPQPKDPSLALNQENVDELVASLNDLSLKHVDK